jgi:Domain of unknown function (DUF4118)
VGVFTGCRASREEQDSSNNPFGKLLMGTVERSTPDLRISGEINANSTSSDTERPLTSGSSAELPTAAVQDRAAVTSAAGSFPVEPQLPSLPATGEESKPVLTQIASIADPFAGFMGYCFLRLCQFLEVVANWMRPQISPTQVAAESLLKSSTHNALRSWGICSLGTICSTVAAAGLIPVFYSSSIKSFLPLAFLVIVVLVALRFGRAAGVLGTLAAAFLFADFLFEPPGLGVSDPGARNHLLWMLILGVVVSDLLARYKTRRIRHKF